MNTKTALSKLNKIKRMNKKYNIRLAGEWNTKYKILIATILSPQTRDEVTIDVCEILFKKYPTMTSLSKATSAQILKIIRPINYSPKKIRPDPKISGTISNGELYRSRFFGKPCMMVL